MDRSTGSSPLALSAAGTWSWPSRCEHAALPLNPRRVSLTPARPPRIGHPSAPSLGCFATSLAAALVVRPGRRRCTRRRAFGLQTNAALGGHPRDSSHVARRGRATRSRRNTRDRRAPPPEAAQPKYPQRIETNGVPIHLYTDDIDKETMEQLKRLAESPLPVGYVSAMPDVHLGKGATIGSVFASRKYVCPMAVGVDIGCGMCAVPLGGPTPSRDDLVKIHADIRTRVPTGFSSHSKVSKEQLKKLEELKSQHNPTPWLLDTIAERHARQLGTLGGGNHFVELVVDDMPEPRPWIMLHSGSRNLGNITATYYQDRALENTGDMDGLEFLSIDSQVGSEYMRDMQFCQGYAAANRQFMLAAVAESVEKVTGLEAIWDEAVNIHHNYASHEEVMFTDPRTGRQVKEKLWITRKGATSAREGQLGLIPGSMATGSYLVRGRGNSESWYSCSHGSGRKLSRSQAKRIITPKDLELTMADIVWDREHSAAIIDEGPSAYKDLEEVMSNQEALVEIVHKFTPVLNMKGWEDKKANDGGEWTDSDALLGRLRGRKSIQRAPVPQVPLASQPDPERPETVPLYPACEGERSRPKPPSFEELPIWEHADAIRAAVERSQVVCVQGETGCGKSSVLPTLLLDNPSARVACTQPRRLAAISLAHRVASLRQEELGDQVGYRVAMDGTSSSSTRLTFVTAGWLLMRLAHTPDSLSRYTHIVLDEIHERDIDADLLLLLLRRELPRFPQLRVILMSATVDTSRFLDYFERSGVTVERDPLVVGVRRFPTWQYFLDDIVRGGALPSASLRVRMERLDRARINQARIDVETQLLNAAVRIVSTVAKPGICVLIFLPGLAEIEQLAELLTSNSDGCPLQLFTLHSVVAPELQRASLEPARPGHAKVVLSTNIAESSVTIPDVRYVIDFGVLRRMSFDDERGMQSLSNSWCSRATCEQRRGRCGRLHEGVVIHMFPRALYNQMPPFADPEILATPLESIYLRAKVLLGRLGSPELLLSQLMDPPPQARIASAARNLEDLGAMTEEQVGPLGRVAVFMPTTIQLTKLIILGWSLGIPADAIVIAAALSVDDIFQMVTPQNVGRPEDFPGFLARNYTVRAIHSRGEFSEPIMYRNLFIDYLHSCRTEDGRDGGVLELRVSEKQKKLGINVTNFPPGAVFVKSITKGTWSEWSGLSEGQEILRLNDQNVKKMSKEEFRRVFLSRPLKIRVRQSARNKQRGKRGYREWVEKNCVSVARMNQFIALVSELAVKFTWAVPTAAEDPRIVQLTHLKGKGSRLSAAAIDDLFSVDMGRIKFALTGAFSPSFVQGEINLANRNEPKFRGCGLDPMKTCYLRQVKPKELRDPELLLEFCRQLAPASSLKMGDKAGEAFVECGPDPDLGPQTVHQMPLLAQLLHQLMHHPCKFEPLTKRGIKHGSVKFCAPNCLNGMKWHVNGMRTLGTPYWRSNLGYMCEMRTELRCHWGVCSSLLGREGPNRTRISGLTILPPPGTIVGTVMILAYLSGPFRVTLLGPEDKWYGIEVVATDAPDLRPMVLTFAPALFGRRDIEAINAFRTAQSAVVTRPSLCTAEAAGRAFEKLLAAVDVARGEGGNNWIPDADHDITAAGDVLTLLPLVRDAGSGPGEWERYELAGAQSVSFLRPVKMAYPEVREVAGGFRLRLLPPWLRQLAQPARQDLQQDLEALQEKFKLKTVKVGKMPPSTHFVEVRSSERAPVEACRAELIDGILTFYQSIAEWSASEANEARPKEEEDEEEEEVEPEAQREEVEEKVQEEEKVEQGELQEGHQAREESVQQPQEQEEQTEEKRVLTADSALPPGAAGIEVPAEEVPTSAASADNRSTVVAAEAEAAAKSEAEAEAVGTAQPAAPAVTAKKAESAEDLKNLDFDKLLELNEEFAEVLRDSGSMDVYREAWQEDPKEWLQQVRDQGFTIRTKKMVLPLLAPLGKKKKARKKTETPSEGPEQAQPQAKLPAQTQQSAPAKAEVPSPAPQSPPEVAVPKQTAEEKAAPAPATATRVAPASPALDVAGASPEERKDSGVEVKDDDGGAPPGLAGPANQSGVKVEKVGEDVVKLSLRSQGMPAYEAKDDILNAIRKNRVVVISGETGCGKSTVIPQLICDAEDLIPKNQLVVCTEPRRVAAITLGEYVSKDRGQSLADEVGYQIRFVNEFTARTRLIFATTAIILRRLHREPDLDTVGCLIIDEVHERDVYTDFLLLLLRAALAEGRMQHLKVIVMSATLKSDELSEYFRAVNTGPDGTVLPLKPLHIPGRMFNVEVNFLEDAIDLTGWTPPTRGGKGKGKGKGRSSGASEEVVREKLKLAAGKGRGDGNADASEQLVQALASWQPRTVYLDLIEYLIVLYHQKLGAAPGSILVFLPGWGDISKLFLRLSSLQQNFQIITLHSLMTPEQQLEAFEQPPAGMRKVILSTNIAETSVTIDDVVYVIDSGVRKERIYNPRTRIGLLETSMVTKANAMQRRGRAGRTAEGVCVHLFPSWMFQELGEFPVPQMLTSSMEEVVLQCKAIRQESTNEEITQILTTSMAAPDQAAVDDAVERLKLMGCLTQQASTLTALGRAVASIPIAPNIAKMLLVAGALRCVKPMAGIAAFLSNRNPFQQQPGQKEEGKEHFDKGFRSDHILMLQAYCDWQSSVRANEGLDFCMDFGLSPEVLDLAQMMVGQLASFVVDMGYDGTDTRSGDLSHVDPVLPGSEVDFLVRAAITAGCSPSMCALYKSSPPRKKPPFPRWVTRANSDVGPFFGSINFQCPEPETDGMEWMAFSDSMRFGNFNRIMDSTLVNSNTTLLFATALHVDFKDCRVRFDTWTASFDPWDGDALTTLVKLRGEFFPSFIKALEAKDLSLFPTSLVARIVAFLMQSPVKLEGLLPMETHLLNMKNIPEEEISYCDWG